MKKLFLAVVCLTSLTLTASGFPTLTGSKAAVPSQTGMAPLTLLAQGIEAHDKNQVDMALSFADLDLSDFSPLYAAHSGDAEILESLVPRLLAQGISLDQQTEKGESALYLACARGDTRSAEFLLNAGANPFLTISVTDFFRTQRDTALNAACKKCPSSTVTLLLQKGGRRLINTTNEHGRTCLHDLCREQAIDIEKLALLLDNGADVNLQDNEGNTPFHYAGDIKTNKQSQKEALELFMHHNADATILNSGGSSPKNKARASSFLLDITNHRALDSFSNEACLIRIKEKEQATAAVVAQKVTQQMALPVFCSICHSEENRNDSHVTIACNHDYHRACLNQWTEHHATCPLCRSTDISEKK